MRLRGGLCFSRGQPSRYCWEGTLWSGRSAGAAPHSQLPTLGRKWGWRSRLEKLLIAAGPFSLVADSGRLSPGQARTETQACLTCAPGWSETPDLRPPGGC